MQWNQPFGISGFQSYPKTVSPAIPQIIGEGDVTAVTFPDGSVQFFFVPTIRQTHTPYPSTVTNPFGSLFSYPINTEVWFVRSITNPQPNVNISVPPGNFNIQLPNTFGECLPYSPSNYCTNTNPRTCHEYTQKFHNDTWTSTTDIQYFYPSLPRAKQLQYCTETQTDLTLPIQKSNIGQFGERNTHCGQSSGIKEEKAVNIECDCHSKVESNFSQNGEWNRNCGQRLEQKTVSFDCDCHPKVQLKSCYSSMSVDSESESERRNKKDKKKKSAKNKNTCEGKQKPKSTSDKIVATCVDQSTEDVAKDGRETQTESPRTTKKSDIKTEKWKPNKQNSRASKTKTNKLKLSSSSDISYFDEYCSCSTTVTDLAP